MKFVIMDLDDFIFGNDKNNYKHPLMQLMPPESTYYNTE